MGVAADLAAELGVEAGTAPQALESLLLRFETRAPHVVAPGYPRAPERVMRELLEDGTGTIGGERTAAVRHLAATLGFASRVLAGTRRTGAGEQPHAALLFDLPNGPALCDPAFPLRGLVPLGDAPVRSPWGTLLATRREGGVVLELDARGRCTAVTTLRVVEDAKDPEGALLALPAPAPGTLVRLFDDRVACWRDGALTLVDAWSRLTQPLVDREAIERLFGAAPPDGRGGPDGPAARDAARLSVYDRSPLPAHALLARVATPQGFLALGTPGLAIAELASTDRGWRWRLEGPDGASRTEEVTRMADGLLVEPEAGAGPLGARRYELEITPEGTRLVLRAALAAAPRGLPEPVRKTLVFHLASELLAWGREG